MEVFVRSFSKLIQENLLQEVFLLNVATNVFILYATSSIAGDIECPVLILDVVFPIHFHEGVVPPRGKRFRFDIVVFFETLECSIDELDSFLNVQAIHGFSNDQSARAVFEVFDLWEVAAGLKRYREDFVTWLIKIHCNNVIASLAVS